ncbi:MAG: translation elongation factor Ts [Bacteroidales bacterium]|jgi:elongation factor Ts|nr:translation elongation factor Ts [Bacteroidales bacterium]
MTQISASEVAKLRKITGAGMMDCKQALAESNGDFDGAIEFLRKKGQKIAAKREDRDAKEGCVLAGVSNDGKTASIVVVSCETDFVAKNEDFIAFTQSVLNVALTKQPVDAEALKALTIGNDTITDLLTDQMGKIGEKIELGYYGSIAAEQCFAYIHPGNKLATIVGFNQTGVDAQVGKDVAMQIAAMNPVSISKDDCPAEIIEKEIEIGKEQAINEGKPAEMAEKIAVGKLNKFYKESTLLMQDFVKDSKITIEQYLQTHNKGLTVTAFKRFGLSN